MEAKNGQRSANSWLAYTVIIIPLVTVSAYSWTLSYEAAFCRYFYIPYYLISLSPTIVLFTSVIFFYILITSLFLFSAIFYLSRGVFQIIKNLTLPKEAVPLNPSPTTGLKELFIVFCIVVIGFGGVSLSSILGYKKAQTQEEFPVITQSPELVVIRSYGEYLLAVPINRVEKKFEKKLVILKMAEIKELLTFEKVGPLKAKP